MIVTAAQPPYTARPGEAIRVFRQDNGDFAIGLGRVAIVSDDARHLADVIKDLGRLVDTPEGGQALAEGDAIGHRVRIVKPERPTQPPNAWVLPDDLASAAAAGVRLAGDAGGARIGTGAGCGSTIAYDPTDWPRPGCPGSPSSAAVLLLLLRQANLNARGAADPSKPGWGTATEDPP